MMLLELRFQMSARQVSSTAVFTCWVSADSSPRNSQNMCMAPMCISCMVVPTDGAVWAGMINSTGWGGSMEEAGMIKVYCVTVRTKSMLPWVIQQRWECTDMALTLILLQSLWSVLKVGLSWI